MSNKTLNKTLSKYLTVQQVCDLLKPNITERAVWRWVLEGIKTRKKGIWSKTKIKLDIPEIQSTVLINPKDLAKYLKQIGREDLVLQIPTFQRCSRVTS